MTPLIQIEHLSHRYGQVLALQDVNLTMAPGAIGLVGQNGAGKSTLMQILLGLIRPTQGTAMVLGESVRRAGWKLRGRIGFMAERDAVLPGLNGIEYVALAGELSGMPRRQALRRAHETLSYLGMEDARYRRLDQFSVGMIQRLKLAATLVHDPDLLLLDEPTSGLDPEGRHAMLSLLQTLATRPGKSLILSSHLLGDIERVCGTTIILNQGRVVRVGSLDELRGHRQPSYRMKWDGDPLTFFAALQQRGVDVQWECAARPGSEEARLIAPAHWNTCEFFAESLRHSIVIKGLEPEEEDLEAVYHRVIGHGPSSSPATEVTN